MAAATSAPLQHSTFELFGLDKHTFSLLRRNINVIYHVCIAKLTTAIAQTMLVFSLGRHLPLSDISRLRIRRNIARMTRASTPPGDGLLKHQPVRGTVYFTLLQTCYMIRITRIRYGFWRFLSDTAVLCFDTDFN